MSKKSSGKYALVLWTESDTKTIEDYSNLCNVTGKKSLKEGWTGELPWEENGEIVHYDVAFVKISSKCHLNSLL